MTARLTQRNMRCPGVLDQDLVQMVLVGERADRGGMPQEQFRALAYRPSVPDVVDDRPADVLEQRQLYLPACLGLHHRDPVAGPVEVGEPQPLDVDAAQPKPGDQQDDRVIAFAARVAPVDRMKNLPHVGRVPYRRDPGLPRRFRRRHRLQHGGLDQPVAVGEPQERPHGAQLLLHRLGLVASQRGHERVDHPRVQASQSAPRADEREEVAGHRDIGSHRRYGAASRLQQPRYQTIVEGLYPSRTSSASNPDTSSETATMTIDPPITKTRHHAEPRDQSPSEIMRSVRSSPPRPPAATARRYA